MLPICASFHNWRDWLRGEVTVEGKLIEAGETMCAGTWSGSAIFTWYEFDLIDDTCSPVRLKLFLPVMTGVVRSPAKPGERIMISTTQRKITIEIRSRFLRRLRHHFQACGEELASHEF